MGMIKQLGDTYSAIDMGIEKAIAEDGSKKEELAKKGGELKIEASKFLWKSWLEAVNKIERDVEDIKKFFDSRTNPEGKTKADVLKEIYAVMQDRAKNKLHPLDEDLVAELSEIPAVPEGTIFKHPWGTASKLYKSEAVDAFGFRYLLGVFETKDEAAKAFKKWNGEYEQKQAKGEFNKKFRKSDEFKEDLPEDKVQAFSKILGKFFEAEVEDYKKDAVDSGPDPDGLLFKGGEAKIDFGLKGKIVEVDRDADRRYYFSNMRSQQANAKGEFFPSSSPLQEHYAFQSNDTESKEKLAKTMDLVKKFLSGNSKGTKLLEDNSEAAKTFEDTGVVMVSEVMIKQLGDAYSAIDMGIEKAIAEDGSKKEELVKKGGELKVEASKTLWKNWLEAVIKIEHDVEDIKKFFDSQTNPEGKTKADVLK